MELSLFYYRNLVMNFVANEIKTLQEPKENTEGELVFEYVDNGLVINGHKVPSFNFSVEELKQINNYSPNEPLLSCGSGHNILIHDLDCFRVRKGIKDFKVELNADHLPCHATFRITGHYIPDPLSDD